MKDMKELEEKLKTVANVAGSLIKSTFGGETEFIIIPIIDTGKSLNMAIISSISGEKLCMSLGAAARQTIEEFDPETASKVREKMEEKTPDIQFH